MRISSKGCDCAVRAARHSSRNAARLKVGTIAVTVDFILNPASCRPDQSSTRTFFRSTQAETESFMMLGEISRKTAKPCAPWNETPAGVGSGFVCEVKYVA